ncbi:MAG: homocysteine methyltransferase, partial [Oscillospiraceae bacterium]
MGTVLQQRGLPPGGKPELRNVTNPDMMRAISREYNAAGGKV